MERKKRKYYDSKPPSVVAEQPLSSCSELSDSSGSEDGSLDTSVSLKSDASIDQPLSFDCVDKSKHGTVPKAPSVVSMKSDKSIDQPLSFGLRKRKHKTKRRHPEHQREMGECAEDSELLKAKKNLKEEMENKFTWVFEGNGDQEISMDKIYSKVIISTAENEGPHEEHVFRHIKLKLEQQCFQQDVILNDIFKPLPGQRNPRKTVLTKGIAGIGKSFTVQKLILDWAKGSANQDIDFVFCLAFRELNLSKDDKSLLELLIEFHPALRSLTIPEHFAKTRVLVILDGLDESRIQLDFKNKIVTSASEVTSVGNLIANLIQGNLLPNAQLWITSRPAAASQIPADFIDMVMEIRGFGDSQKEEYFRRRFSHELDLAERIIFHIHSSPSLDIMCQIPIFCWMSAVLFQECFGGDEKTEIPQTLTEMMGHFLFAQTKRRNRKYEQKTEEKREELLKTHKEFLLKLGKLAFVQLQKNNLIFYEEDLEDCGIDITEATIYSGLCDTVLREEKIFSQKKIFFFVHLTIQEFFAALFVYDCFTNRNTIELVNFLNFMDKEHTLLDLLKMTVDKVLEKKYGHLDFFLRFLLGLMVEHNREILQGLLTSPDSNQDTDKKILTYLKAIRRRALPPDSSINLFQAMVEMRDHKVKDEIQEYLKLSDRSKTELTPLHCSALAYMLQVSKNDLDVLDLKSLNTSEEGRRRLIPAVRSSKKAILTDCKVTEEWIEHLAFGLKFPYSALKDLDLSNNDLKDSGVKLLCKGLSSQFCRLEILRLSGCQVSEEGCSHLCSSLKSNPSHLIELDLSYNNPGDSGVKMLSELKADQHNKLEKLNVEHGGSHRMKLGFKKYPCELTLDPDTAHTNLLLSDKNRKVTWVEGDQPYPNHRDRFKYWQQVLCEQGLKERYYFEVEVEEPFTIGVTYITIERKGNGDDCRLGCNDKSWCLTCSDDGCYVKHCNDKVSVSSLCPRSSQVGVYLDWPAGTLSFYRVLSDSKIRLHTYKTTFTEALYPAVELHTSSYALFCQMT